MVKATPPAPSALCTTKFSQSLQEIFLLKIHGLILEFTVRATLSHTAPGIKWRIQPLVHKNPVQSQTSCSNKSKVIMVQKLNSSSLQVQTLSFKHISVRQEQK